jgi:octaprenyl-diphosphate synthase
MGAPKRLKAIQNTAELALVSQRIQGLVGEKLSRVEKVIADNIQAPYSPVAEMGTYLAASRGKRLRPTLLLLTSKMLGYEGEQDVRYAAIFEFIHTATLIHDDIVDQALLRRGRASLSSRWGPELAVLMGDRVFIMAMNMAVQEGWSPILPLISRTTLKLIEGELIQSHRKWDLTLRREDNLEIIKDKTAFLFAACAITPAHLVGAPQGTLEALEAFGVNLGIAFQVIDDCLDFVSDEATLGKPAGNDLKEGKITLPLLLLLERGTPEDRAFIEAVIAARRFDPDTLREVTDRVIESGMLAAAEGFADDYARAAQAALLALPPDPIRDLLQSLPEYLLRRRY